MSPKSFEYRDFEVTAFAERSFTVPWVATYYAFPCAESSAESAEEVLSFKLLYDGQKPRLVWNAEEAIAEAAALARGEPSTQSC